MKFKDLTKEKQSSFRERYMEYMKDEYEEDFNGSQDKRSWSEWAYDKAWNDVVYMDGEEEKCKK